MLFAKSEARAQYQTLVSDTFSVQSSFLDVSRRLNWGYNQGLTSAFVIGPKSDKSGLIFSSLSLTDSAMKYGRGFTASRSLKTCSAIDYTLPGLERENDTLTIEFDAFWDTLAGIGEGGRIVLALLHQYPAGGPRFGDVDSVQIEAPFGRPAYNIRILNRRDPVSGITAPGYLFYGGGMDPLGEFEKTANWWLPGFIAQPGGTSPQTGAPYPIGATTRIADYMASSQSWRHFTFKLFPEYIEIWLRNSSSPDSANQRISKIPIPKTQTGIPYAVGFLNQFFGSNISNLPLNYKWYPKMEAVRFYFRAVNQAYLANVKIKYSGTISAREEVLEKSGMQLFPNPNTNGVFFASGLENEDFWVMDMLGRKRAEGKVLTGKLNISFLPSGRYYVFFSSSKQKIKRPFTIQIIK